MYKNNVPLLTPRPSFPYVVLQHTTVATIQEFHAFSPNIIQHYLTEWSIMLNSAMLIKHSFLLRNLALVCPGLTDSLWSFL